MRHTCSICRKWIQKKYQEAHKKTCKGVSHEAVKVKVDMHGYRIRYANK